MFEKKEIQELYALIFEIQECIYEYINDDSNNQIHLTNLMRIIDQSKIKEDKYSFKELLNCISKISKNHHRNITFISKIEAILLQLKENIMHHFSNIEIFIIFKSSKRILLFLLEQNIIIPDEILSSIITHEKFKNFNYPSYFYPEFKSFYDESLRQKIEAEIKGINNFEEKRKIGENDNYICELIRNDMIEDFTAYINRLSYPISSLIENSLFETNTLLLKTRPSLVEYSLFFGATQIYTYLYMNGITTDNSFWTYVIHSKNAELLHNLENNIDKTFDGFNTQIIKESIKCHHNEFFKYFEDNYLQSSDSKDWIFQLLLKYHNFLYFPHNISMDTLFMCLCNYDHYAFIRMIDNDQKIPIHDISYYEKVLKKGNTEIVNFILNLIKLNVIRNELKNNKFLISLKIPPSVNKIAGCAFKSCLSLAEVELSPKLDSISYATFEFCVSIEKVTIPSSVKLIGDLSFKGCTSLKKIKIPSSVNTIGSSAFSDCSNLSEVEFTANSGLVSLGFRAFKNCLSLSKIDLPNSLSKMGVSVFNRCESLEEIKLPDKLNEIPADTFCFCKNLKKIHIPSSVEKIESNAFDGCSSLQQISIPFYASSIGCEAFKNCSSLKHISFPSSLSSIPQKCCQGCSSLTDVDLPSTLISIENFAFQGCSSLKKISIPRSVKLVEDTAFADCVELTEIINESKT